MAEKEQAPAETVKVQLLMETGYELPSGGHKEGAKDEVITTTPLSGARLIALGKAKAAVVLLLLTLLLALLGSARAGVLIGSLSPITTATTNSPTFITNNAFISVPAVFVANNGLAITNAYWGFFRWSFDNTTFYTNASPVFIPTVTNATSYTIAPQTITVPVYIQLLAVTNSANTLTINIGASTP